MGLLAGIDVCAGSGIGSWVFEAIGLARTVCYIEREPYCQQLIQRRIEDGWLRDAPIWDDLRTFDGRPWRGRADFMHGGIPCQPWSVAGKRRGSADERDLWPSFFRVVSEIRPRMVLVENVPGLFATKRGGPRVREADDGHVIARWYEKAQQSAVGRMAGDLSEIGYDAEWTVVSAAAVGAPHLRERVWLVAYPERESWEAQRGDRATVAHSQRKGLEGREGERGDPFQECEASERGCCQEPASGSNGGRCYWRQDIEGQESARRVRTSETGEEVADAELARLERESWCGLPGAGRASEQSACGSDGCVESNLRRVADGLAAGLVFPGTAWPPEPHGMPRVKSGVPNRKQRLTMLGNGWCAQQAAYIGLRILSALQTLDAAAGPRNHDGQE